MAGRMANRRSERLAERGSTGVTEPDFFMNFFYSPAAGVKTS